MAQTPRRPSDANQIAESVADLATGEVEDELPAESDMAKLGRAGELSGGVPKSQELSPERHREIAQRAAASPWGKENSE